MILNLWGTTFIYQNKKFLIFIYLVRYYMIYAMIQNQISFWGQKDTVWQIARAGAKISPKSRKSPLWGWGETTLTNRLDLRQKTEPTSFFKMFSFQQTSVLINGTALSGWQQLVTTQCNIGEYLRWNSLPDLISQNFQLAAGCVAIYR